MLMVPSFFQSSSRFLFFNTLGQVRLPHREEMPNSSFPLPLVFTYQNYPIAGAASVLASAIEAAAAAAAVAAAVAPGAAVASVPAARAPFLLPSTIRAFLR